MINIEKRLREELTIVQLLKLLQSVPSDLTGRRGYILVPQDFLGNASRSASDTINYCKEHEFIEVKPMGSKCYELHITGKGLAFMRMNSGEDES